MTTTANGSGTGSATGSGAGATAVIDSPIGRLGLRVDDAGLREIRFLRGRRATTPVTQEPYDHPLLTEVARQLRAYFAGELTTFDLPLAAEGSPFHQRVWSAMREIPYGHTWSYGEQAAWVGGEANPRTVGAANGQNPIPIVVPCHRVIGSDGKLVGYGGGLDVKRRLLELEARVRIVAEFGT